MKTKTKALDIPPEGISNMIDKLSRGVPVGKFLRELVKNGYDAHQRGEQRGSSVPTITVARDKMRANKMVIANSVPADPITEGVAINSLNALFNPKSSSKTNHGIGAKIAYLPQNPLGLLYRCRAEGIQFTIHKDAENIYGLRTELDDNGEPHQIFECQSDEFTFPDSETEVVLMGRTEEEDTWMSTLKVANPRRDSSYNRFAGWSIRNYFNECFWVNPDKNVDFKIAIYDDKGKFREWSRPRFLESIKKAQTTIAGGCNGVVVHPDGTEIHYWALKFEKGKKKGTHHGSTAGHIGYIHNDEVFVNKKTEESARRRKMENAGIITHNKNVSLMIKFSESVPLSSLLDRSAAVDEDGTRADDLMSIYTDYFREHMPSDLKEWMANLFIHTPTDVVREAAKFYKEPATIPRDTRNRRNDSEDESNDDSDDNNNSNPRKRGRKSGKNKKGKGKPPSFIIVDEGAESPLVSFPLKAYTVAVNCTNPLFAQEMDRFEKDAPEEVLKTCIAESIYLNTCSYHSRIIKSYPADSVQQTEDRLTDDKLNSLIVSVGQMAKDRVARQIAKNLKTQQLEEKAA